MMRRGDLFTAVIPGDYGKPRPVVIIQSDILNVLDSVVICPITSVLARMDFRVTLEPSLENGLEKPSQIMVDKILTIPRSKMGQGLGQIDARTRVALDRALLLVMGLS